MQRREPSFFFDEKVALEYDRRNEEYAPLLDALHLLMSTIFSDLPADSRVLSVGAGTGSELIDLAHQFPQWRFTAVEPSAPMLDVCRRRTDECGIASRCDYHEGYLDSLAPSEAFDAATSILVSQFLLDLEARSRFFKAVADRLAPGGYLVSADLAYDKGSSTYESLLDVWFRLRTASGKSNEKIDKLRIAYDRDVAIPPLDQLRNIIASGGFETPLLFLQTGLIHAWYAKRILNR